MRRLVQAILSVMIVALALVPAAPQPALATSGVWSPAGSMTAARLLNTLILLNNGKVLAVSGRGANETPVLTADVYDPSSGTWSATGQMSTDRYDEAAVLLPSGKVLVAGGYSISTASYLVTAELYDPSTNTWAPTGSMLSAQLAQGVLLPNGKVLVAGSTDAEVYDPSSGLWVKTGNLAVPRTSATMTLLSNGKVLVAGGRDSTSTVVASAELYDPTSGAWAATGSMTVPRVEHTATVLSDGRVLVTGGCSSQLAPPTNACTTSLANAEIYSPSTGTWSAVASMATGRALQSATRLSNGSVLVAGGYTNCCSGSTPAFGSTEVYDPGSNSWSAAGSLNAGRYAHGSVLLPNGQVLVSGGAGIPGNGSTDLASAELFSGASWSPAGSMSVGRAGQTATLLANGKVLVAGGFDANGSPTASADLYNTSTGAWTPTGNMGAPRTYHTATLLPNGKVLVTGGQTDSGSGPYLASAELYDPNSGTWSPTGNMNAGRMGHSAVLLNNGKVLAAGGWCTQQQCALSSAETYDPSTGLWTPTSNAMSAGRALFTATLLNNGQVLAAGGNGCCPYSSLASADLYNPSTNAWSPAAGMHDARTEATANVLAGGKVLIAGGVSGTAPNQYSLATAEVYDPSSGTWTSTGSMSTPRSAHTATVLSNGQVLVAGGSSGGTAASGGQLSSAELYDPGTGIWWSASGMATARWAHTATLLNNGQVLVTGGNLLSCCGWSGIATAELYGTSSLGPPVFTSAPTSPVVMGGSATFQVALSGATGVSGQPVTWTVSGPNGTTQAVITYTTSSGIATFTYTGNNVGTDTITASITVNGNTVTSSPQTVTWQYQQSGLCNGEPGHAILQPVNPNGSTLSVFKYGSMIPFKFRVCNAQGVSVGAPTNVVVSLKQCNQTANPNASVDESTYSGTADTAFRWDSTAQQWIYNFSTKTSGLTTGVTYTYCINLNDTSAITFQFALK